MLFANYPKYFGITDHTNSILLLKPDMYAGDGFFVAASAAATCASQAHTP